MALLPRLRLLLSFGRGVLRGLPAADEGKDPIALFGEWFGSAEEAGLYLPEAMALSTATPDGFPSSRMVLLKSFDERGFAFFTNHGSRKAAELDENPRAALLFHWNVLQRQVRVEGTVGRIPLEESAAYFASRGRGSQLGAWASRQSAPLPGRGELEERMAEVKRRFQGKEVPLPPFWGGYRLVPRAMEFWQGRADRLHDRLRFTREGQAGPWEVTRLYP
jgi:pyridoxamine 5'-phosphate oxidase